jgi:hypothetical protein
MSGSSGWVSAWSSSRASVHRSDARASNWPAGAGRDALLKMPNMTQGGRVVACGMLSPWRREPKPRRSLRRPPYPASLAIVLLLSAAAAREAAPAKEYLYVANTLGGDISVIEAPAHRIVATIPATVVRSPERRPLLGCTPLWSF